MAWGLRYTMSCAAATGHCLQSRTMGRSACPLGVRRQGMCRHTHVHMTRCQGCHFLLCRRGRRRRPRCRDQTTAHRIVSARLPHATGMHMLAQYVSGCVWRKIAMVIMLQAAARHHSRLNDVSEGVQSAIWPVAWGSQWRDVPVATTPTIRATLGARGELTTALRDTP